MRNFLLFFLIVFFCSCQQPAKSQKSPGPQKSDNSHQPASTHDNNLKVLYHAFTRGIKVSVTIEKDSIYYLEQGWEGEDRLKMALSDQDEKKLENIVQEINLPELPQLAAPTQARHRDGDWFARVEIHTSEGTFQSQDFDKGQPIKELIPLISFLQNKLDKDLGVENSEQK